MSIQELLAVAPTYSAPVTCVSQVVVVDGPSAAARGLASRQSGMVGICLPDVGAAADSDEDSTSAVGAPDGEARSQGLLRSLKRHGIDAVRTSAPPITTVEQLVSELGCLAVERLTARITSPKRRTTVTTAPVTVTLRASCGTHLRSLSATDDTTRGTDR